MAEPFLAEIRMMSFGYAPVSQGWALCNGQLLPINQNQALFSLLGTTYGGNGQTNFALPDLRGKVPIHMGQSHTLGETGGQAAHTVTISEMPEHLHFLQATTATASTNIPASTLLLGNTAPNDLYTGAASLVALQPATVSNVGGSQPHLNMQPFLTISFCIALQGIFPSQN
ncbi:MAG: tail fiber protein [Pseudomonadota bacterium]